MLYLVAMPMENPGQTESQRDNPITQLDLLDAAVTWQRSELIRKHTEGTLEASDLFGYLAADARYMYQNVLAFPQMYDPQAVAPIQERRLKLINDLESGKVTEDVLWNYHEHLDSKSGQIRTVEYLERKEAEAKLFNNGTSIQDKPIPQGAKNFISSLDSQLIRTELSALIACRKFVQEGVDGADQLVPIYDPRDQIELSDENFTYDMYTESTRVLREATKLTGSPMTNVGGIGLEWAIKNTPKEVGVLIQAHGIAKNPVENLDKLMANGITPDQTFYSMSFVDGGEGSGAFGADMPKTGGGIIVLSEYGQHFGTGQESNIKYIIVGEEYVRCIDALNQRYTGRGVRVVSWNEIPYDLVNDAKVVGQMEDPKDWPQDPEPTYLRYKYPEKVVGPARIKSSKDSVPTQPITDIDTAEAPDIW